MGLLPVITKMETMEKVWKDAGNEMRLESYVVPLRRYLDFLRMPGTVISLSGTTMDGKPFDIEQYRGKVVVFHYWATWCAPCIRQIPVLTELYEKYGEQGFVVLGICYDNELERALEFVERHELRWISLFDKDWEILNRFSHGNSTFSVLLDREGKAVFYSGNDELREKLAELFAGKEQ